MLITGNTSLPLFAKKELIGSGTTPAEELY